MTEPQVPDLVRRSHLKAEMLCLGIRPTQDAMRSLGRADRGFIHGTVIRLSSGEIVNTALRDPDLLADPDDPRSGSAPIFDIGADGRTSVSGKAGSSHAELLSLVDVLGTPLHGLPLGAWFTLHSPTTAFCAPVRQCAYIAIGRPCRFCTFESGPVDRLTIPEFAEGLDRCLSSGRRLTSVAIGGGTPILSDMGAAYFASLVVEATRKGLDASVEMVPPPREESLAELRDAGVSSIIMSIEVWSESARALWCLGKSDVSKAHYERAWEWSVALLGRGRVASVLLVGTEDLELTLAGARQLIERGVIPTMIPLRRYGTSRFASWQPVRPDDYLALEFEVASELRRAGLSPTQAPGCTACGGCSLELLALSSHSRDAVSKPQRRHGGADGMV